MHPMLNIAVRAARNAGDIIVRHLNRLDQLTVSSKERNDFVSEADRQAEAEIIAVIRKAYPGHSVLAEESGRDPGDSDEFQWIIDPLDGTTNFLHGFPQLAVSIALQHESDAFLLRISGRIDGVFSETDAAGATRTVIDEIKTTDRDLDQLAADQNSLHWGQVKCYAYMFAVEHQLTDIDAQLTYYHFDSGETREVRRTFTLDELSGFFRDLIDRYLGWATILVDWQQRREGLRLLVLGALSRSAVSPGLTQERHTKQSGRAAGRECGDRAD